MRRFTFAEILVASVLMASALSASACIIPGNLSRAYSEWVQKPTPEAEQAWPKAKRWPLREHLGMAANLSVAFIITLGCINLLLPAVPDPGRDAED